MSGFHANILTLFPDMFPGPLGEGVTGRALDQDLWSLSTTNIRDFATDNYRTVDDTPFGGGAGMVMKPDILESAVNSVPTVGRLIYLSPRGRVLDQKLARELGREENLTLLCGR
ncbi:MAG: tRNA (guanosine(37)-N1)-methyltransferase TrmD, partial [Pseudomonadota bacterium]